MTTAQELRNFSKSLGGDDEKDLELAVKLLNDAADELEALQAQVNEHAEFTVVRAEIIELRKQVAELQKDIETTAREAAKNLASDSAHIPMIQKIIIDAHMARKEQE